MTNRKIATTLRLIDANARRHSQPSSTIDNDDWLTNDDESLLQEGSDNLSDVLNPAIEDTAPEANKTFTVDQLEIKQVDDDFLLSTTDGEVKLQTGDRVVLPTSKLDVEVVKVEMIQNPEPIAKTAANQSSSEFDDLWALATSSTPPQPDNSVTLSQQDTYAAPEPSTPSLTSSWDQQSYNSDPLNFLYDGEHNSSQNHNTTLPSYDTPSSVSPLLLLETSNLTSNNTPSYMSEPGPQVDNRRYHNLHEQKEAQEGNVLNDLGINENASNIIDSTSGTLNGQSPADMLDQFLTDDDEYMQPQSHQQYTNQEPAHYPAPAPIQNQYSNAYGAYNHEPTMNEQKPSFLGSLKAITKKLIN